MGFLNHQQTTVRIQEKLDDIWSTQLRNKGIISKAAHLLPRLAMAQKKAKWQAPAGKRIGKDGRLSFRPAKGDGGKGGIEKCCEIYLRYIPPIYDRFTYWVLNYPIIWRF